MLSNLQLLGRNPWTILESAFAKLKKPIKRDPEAIVLLQEIYDHYEEGLPDGPGHCHSTPGHWDVDGSLCEWCATWNRVRLMLSKLPLCTE